MSVSKELFSSIHVGINLKSIHQVILNNAKISDIHGICDRVKIKLKRQAVLGALETYVASKPLQTPTRFGNLLLLLPSLQVSQLVLASTRQWL